MAKKARNKEARAYLDAVASLGCAICWHVDGRTSEAAIHHPTGAGMGLRADDFAAIPLCGVHHQTGPFGVAVHNGTKTWEATFGTQAEWSERTRDAVQRGSW